MSAYDLVPPSEETVTIYERSQEGRRAFTPPATDVPERPLDELIPARLLRAAPARLPEVSEPEIVRHYVRLSTRNFHLDEGFYPLGSCTIEAISSRLRSNSPSVFGFVSIRQATSPSALARRSSRSTPPRSSVPTLTTS